MEEFEIRLFDLLEAKAFDALTATEKSFVLQHLTEEEYQLQRRIMTEADDLEFEAIEPAPLVVPGKKPILVRTIPLYQALIGAACLLVGFFLFSPNREKELNVVVSPTVFSLATDVASPQFIHDTIVQIVPGKGSVQRVIRDTISITEYVLKNNTPSRMLEAGNLPALRLDQSLLETRSKSLKDDGSIGLLPKMNDLGSMK